MADEALSRTVLCEAMEYLSRLATNLGSRTESMKEKRINKSKLKDSQSVKSAAEKVLLLCQLSKKSLENVEKSIKDIMEGGATNSGGKTSDVKKPDKISSPNKKDSSTQRTISEKKYGLKMPKGINVNYYKSVKVLAKSMPMSMLDNYPVYYYCKLYHQRRRQRKQRNKEKKNSQRKDEISEQEQETFKNDAEELINCSNIEKNESKTEKSDEGSMPESKDNIEERKNKNKSKAFDTEETYSGGKISSRIKGPSRKREDRRKQFDSDFEESHCTSDSKNSTKKKKVFLDSSDSENASSVKEATLEQSELSVIELDSDKNQHISIENESDCERDNAKNYSSEDSLLKQKNFKGYTKQTTDLPALLKKPDSTRSRKDSHSGSKYQSSSADEHVQCESTEKIVQPELIASRSDSEKITSDKSDSISAIELESNIETNQKEYKQTDKNKGEEKENGSVDDKSDVSKPIIKCVSLSKLLKPSVAFQEKPKDDLSNIQTIVHMNCKGELRTKIIESKTKISIEKIKKNANSNCEKLNCKKITKQQINELWTQKKKDIKSFIPKKFTININRLSSTYSVDFLQKYNLKRITQNGLIVFEVPNGINNSVVKSNSSKRAEKDSVEHAETILIKAKYALLNDSDAEKESSPADNLAHETENVKKSLLNDSESDKSEDREIDRGHVERTKKLSREPSLDKTKEKESDIGHVKSTQKLSREPSLEKDNEDTQLQPESNASPEKETPKRDENKHKEEAKSALLNNSSDSSSTVKKRKRNESTPKSRRKTIMESMHAKKMLLTYSSSSDTEDEQLKNILKDIKETLLKDVVSDDERTKNEVKKKILSSSDSDQDIFKPEIKKRKISKSHRAVELDSNDGSKKLEAKKNGDSYEDKSSKTSHKKMGRSREKQDGSCSNNSDIQEDKDIEGLTNLKSLTNSRQRRGSGSDKAETSSRRGKMAKTQHIKGEEGLLEASISSDEGSGGESNGAEEDLPTVSLSELNGGALGHLAKDDLLGESESDSSKDKSSDNVKKDDDSDSENVKAKRRKANALSSDSEAGSSRRKVAAAVKISDFEDSEDDGSEPAKNKRKKESDSDASAGSSSDGGKKKRRRIKQINDSDVSGSDTENEGKSKHGRKNIRKVMGKNQLEEATKKAARQEKERLARIAERQKMYNNLEFDESGKPDEVVLDKVVLDFDPETKEPLIEVDRGLVKKLKPHQANGIKFMWDACFESVKRIKKDKGSGCILAHCMGLGKTLQVVSLTHTLLTHSDLTNVHRVLVVCPLSTVLNWVNEFKMWLKHSEVDYEVDVYELSRHKQNTERAFQLSQWYQHGGVCVLGYEMFRNLSADNTKKYKKKMLRQLQEALVDPGPDLVVCDEGHLLKNEKTSLSQSMNKVKTLRRIVLTGTPLQNNLKEYYCMVQFVKPNLLGKYNEYLNRFVNPITNGQYTDSTEQDIRVMKRRSHVLHKMLDGAVQRRDYGVLAPFLPPKHEYVLFITLTDVQVKLYQHYLDNYSRRPLPGKSSGFLFPDFQSLQRIWTHPLVLKYNSERYEIMQQKKRDREEEDSEGSLVDFIDDDSTPDETSSEDESDSLSDVSDDSRKKSKKKKSSKKSKTKDSKGGARRGTRANPVELVDAEPDPEILEVKNENPTEWWIPLVTEDEVEDMRNSNKLVLLFEILRQCEAIGDKLLVFSQSLYSLDLIEHFLGKVDEATQEGRIDEKLGGHVGSWSPGIDYFRLDGSTSCENRSIWCKNFNREDNPRARLFLISTRAGGLGINLVAANRVVIFDVSWNPSHDVQSIFRVYRFGQKKPCYVYRFLAMGTMEEKIYERQVTKQAISKRVIDEQQIDRHYAENDLAELYKFEPRPPAPRPVPLVPKDRFFAEMLKDHDQAIYKFHEHDSLLENKEEETLSEEERKAAWEDFENEKNRPPPAPFPNWPMHNGMVPNLLAQQQQQLAYAALSQMLRKDMPNLTDESIRNMLPIIYGANPGMFGGYDYGLMQKLSDMYKYTQPGMMNPAMMNPVMNPGGGAGGMSGASGLQYEPPWQRQQQQQQQMRLQQLMQQQQNQMGAKLYAGGLGSRDPVAMALQQQRAREIMLGGAGRPRGRPPLAPRAPPAPPLAPDVVDLDSD